METNVLDNLDPYKLGEQLQQARRKKGLTQEDAARVLDVGRTTIVAIEKGERRIRPHELVTLARTYSVNITDFVRPKPDIDTFHVQFRGPWLPSTKDSESIAKVVDELEGLCRDYLQLEEITGSPLPRKYPIEYPITNMRLDQSAESVAIDERHRLGLGDGPVNLIRDILEAEVGLRIFYLVLPSTYSAMYFYAEQLGGCIAVNVNHPEERRRWSLVHDYAHFLTTRYKPLISSNSDSNKPHESEVFADAFSLYFLMPTTSITRKYQAIARDKESISVGDLCFLANYYGVSLDALTRRLEGLRLIRTGIGDALRKSGFKVREAQNQLALPTIPQRADVLPVRYQYLALDAFRSELIGEGEFTRLLRADGRVEARRFAESMAHA